MYVQMENGLPAVTVCIYDDTITIIGKTLISCDACPGGQKTPQEGLMILAGSVKRIDMNARDYKNMCRRLRAKVVECNAMFVLINPNRRNFTRNDLAENAILPVH